MTGPLLADVRCRRGGFVLEVTLRVDPGEIVGVVGPNGAGKTTLLRALAGLEPLESGRITVGDRVLVDPALGIDVPVHQRRMAHVFQDHRLFPHLSVRDNVGYAARARRNGRRGARAAASPWLEELELVGLADRRPYALSGGQAQRVALARALASEPDVVLLDEPFAALDAHARLELRGSLRRHLRTFGGPALVITHDPIEALVLADRLVVLDAGRVVQEASPAEVARRPATAYVARLMGLNLYRGLLADPATGTLDVDGGGRLVCGPIDPTTWLHTPDGPDAPDAPDGPAVPALAALAPSAVAVHLTRPGAGSPRNVWPGTVAGLELLTDRVRLRVTAGPGGVDALVDVTPAAVAELGLDLGSAVWLSAKASEIELYPAGP